MTDTNTTANKQDDPLKREIKVSEVRCLYPHVLEPHGFQNQKKKFSITLLVPKGSPAAKELGKLMTDLKKANGYDNLPSDRVCMTDGDTSDKPGSDGHWLCKFSNNVRPQVYDARRNKIEGLEGVTFYSGCEVSVIVSMWFQNNQYGQRVNGNLHAIQFVRDNDALSGRAPKDHTDDFPEYDPPANEASGGVINPAERLEDNGIDEDDIPF